jgi:hypothetical protein
MLRNTEEQVEGQLPAVVEYRGAAGRVERGHAPTGNELDTPLVERRQQRRRCVGRRWYRGPERKH